MIKYIVYNILIHGLEGNIVDICRTPCLAGSPIGSTSTAKKNNNARKSKDWKGNNMNV